MVMSADAGKRIALLTDAENVPAQYVGRVIDELERYGRVVVRRAYGDFNGPQASVWEEAFARHAIVPQHQYAYGRGKNSADIALVIDAMDLLHAGEVEAFSIISSDSDFLRLAIRIREQSVDCYVFGSAKTPERFRRAATRFIYLESLRYSPLNVASHARMKSVRPAGEVLRYIREAIAQLVDDDMGSWVQLDLLERELERQHADFDPRNYGHLQLKELLAALKRNVVVDPQKNGQTRVRLKMRKQKTKSRSLLGAHMAPDEAGSTVSGG
jgi:uncharacterized LabA/DUF88 family protein